MTSTIKDRDEIPIGIKWEWDDLRKCLTYKTNVTLNDKSDKKKKTKDGKIDLRSGVPRLIAQNRNKLETTSLRQQINTHVTMQDVKNATLFMLSERYYIPAEFENLFKNAGSKAIILEFMLRLANYFYWFFESQDSQVVKNELCIERSREDVQKTERAQQMLKMTLRSVARAYCMLILGIEASEYHHMNSGKKRVSNGFRDRGIFETLYPFCITFIWITFKRRDYELIRSEIGRILRSDAFNSSVKFENILEEENDKFDFRFKQSNSKEAILKRFEENKLVLNEFKNLLQKKQSSAVVKSQRSPALVSLLPSPQENSQGLLNRKNSKKIDALEKSSNEKNIFEDDDDLELNPNVGIIGQPMKLFHVKTLAVRGTNEDEQNDNQEKNEEGRENDNDQQDEPLSRRESNQN